MSKFKKKSISLFRDSTSRLVIIALVLVGLFVTFYVIRHIVVASKSEIETQIALKETVYSVIDAKGFIIRDETFLKNSALGTRVSFVKNGEKVATGDTVSTVFESSDDASAYLKISELKKSIKHFEELSGQGSYQALNVNSLNDKINSELFSYLDAIDNKNFSTAISESENFRDSITSKQLATGSNLDFTEKLESLRTELNSLESEKYSFVEVKAEKSGYYIEGADGYEATIDFSEIDKITIDDVKTAISSNPQTIADDVIGRCIPDFNWYIACVVPSNEIVDININKTMYINFPNSGIERLPVRIHKLGDRSADETLVIFKCSVMNESLADLRIEDMQIVLNEYTGYKVSNTSIRTVDGEKGVYTVRGSIVDFKKIHIIYSEENFTLVDNPDNEEGYILPYDNVVTKGVELNDDKLLQ